MRFGRNSHRHDRALLIGHGNHWYRGDFDIVYARVICRARMLELHDFIPEPPKEPTMRSIALLSVMLLTVGAARPLAVAPAPTPPQSPPRVDHILLWGRSIDEVTSIMSVKLGFQVRPGHDPSGVANRYVRLADRGFVELLGITRPNPELDPGSQADQASLHGGAGARSFGIYSSTVDALRSTLKAKGFAVTPVFSAAPAKVGATTTSSSSKPDWWLFAFEKQPLSSALFFIDYSPSYAMPTSVADDRIVRTHPNSAQALSAVWILSANADANRDSLAKMGFASARPVLVSRMAARGYCIPVGPNYVIALQPDGEGISAETLSKGGPQVLGISIAVSDLDRAQRWVERGYEQKLDNYDGALGKSFLAPTQSDLGLFVEFHAATASGAASTCGDSRK